MDEAGAMHFRQLLPEGRGAQDMRPRWGRWGRIIHAGLTGRSPATMRCSRVHGRVQRRRRIAWVQGGWDGNRDGVMEGVQHNTYDVEFSGPNPLCGIYYLGALRAGEEMARATGDIGVGGNIIAGCSSREVIGSTRTFSTASFISRKCVGFRKDEIAKQSRGDMGADNTETPEYQVGGGCLADSTDRPVPG